jgi:hypothetical protein
LVFHVVFASALVSNGPSFPSQQGPAVEHAKKAAEFLERAEECELIAKLATTDESKAAYIRMAQLYRQLSAEESKLTGSGLPVA